MSRIHLTHFGVLEAESDSKFPQTQGTMGQHALVDVEKWVAPLPPITVTAPPEFVGH